MKKLILFFSIVLIAFAGEAQRTALMPSNNTFYSNRIVTADSIKNAGVKTWILETARHQPFTYDVQMKIDTVTTPAASSGVSIQLVGKKFANDAWSNVGSAVVWKSLVAHTVGKDTTITWSGTTTVRYRYLGLVVTGAGTHAMRPSIVQWKLWQD
jgi:hypothetical protein